MSGAKGQPTDSMSNVREKRGARGHHSVSENLGVEEKVHYVDEKSFDTILFPTRMKSETCHFR